MAVTSAVQKRNRWSVFVQRQPWEEPAVYWYRNEEFALDAFLGFCMGQLPAWIEMRDPSGNVIKSDTNERWWR